MEWHDVQRQAGLGFRRVDLLLDRPVEPAVEEHRMVVAAGAPLRRLDADDILHVLDRLAVPLIVERRHVVRRRVPLVVDLLVAASAGRAGHEEVRGNRPADVRAGGRREERRARSAAFTVHADRRIHRVHNRIAGLPLPLQRGFDNDGHDDGGAQQQDAGRRQPPRAGRRGAAGVSIEPGGRQQDRDRGEPPMGVQHTLVRAGRADRREPDADRGAEQEDDPHRRGALGPPVTRLHAVDQRHDRDDGAEADVQGDVCVIEERRRGDGREVRAVGHQQEEAGDHDSRETGAGAHRGFMAASKLPSATSL